MLLTGGPTGPSGPSLPGAPLGPCVNELHRKIFQSVKLIFYFGICNCKSKLLCTWYYTNSYVKYCVKIYEYICTMPYLVKYIEIQNNDVYALDTMAHLWSFCSLWTGSSLRSCWTSVSFSSLVYKENN